jgi:hypothetical protein
LRIFTKKNEAVLVRVRPEARDAVVEARGEVDALAAAAVEDLAVLEADIEAGVAN